MHNPERMRQLMHHDVESALSKRCYRRRGDGRPAAPADGSAAAGAPVTRGPSWSHDPRFQCAPGEHPYGAGFSAVGIGHDVTTGEAWR